MRIVKRMGLVLVVVCAMSAMAVSSASAAPMFLSSVLGKLLATADNTQKFFTPGGKITMECKSSKLNAGEATSLLATSLLVIVKYEGCLAVGGLTATVHPVHLLLFANGSKALLLTVKILIPAAGCTITLPSAKNQNLNTSKFDHQTDGSVLELAKISGITSFGEGTGCKYAEESNGTYEGNVRITVEGGTLSWEA
jgi:hypothetical protein